MPENPLRDLRIRNSDLTGWSQSGSYDVTYLNAISRHAAMPNGESIFDGYLPGAGSYAGTPINQCAPTVPWVILGFSTTRRAASRLSS